MNLPLPSFLYVDFDLAIPKTLLPKKIVFKLIPDPVFGWRTNTRQKYGR